MTRIIGLDLKRNLNKTGIIILALLILSTLFFNYLGIRNIERLDKAKEEFIKNENQKTSSYYSYNQYGWYGFKLLFIPSQIESIFIPKISNNLQSSCGIGFRFDINNPQKGQYLFQKNVGLG
jgi:hypothetical protein